MSSTETPATTLPADENHIITERRTKLSELRRAGNAFPNDFRRNALAGELASQYADTSKETLESAHIEVAIAGRMMLKRVMGKASFATVQDMAGRIQIFISGENVGSDIYDAFKRWDLGDIVAAKGILFRTNKGELSVKCQEIRLLTKSLRPLPEKFHGLTDQEQRYRQRYLDLIMNPEAKRTFEIRSKLISFIRNF